MIVVDTSVWVAATREPSTRVAATLRGLIDADDVALALPVRLELMAGVARKDRAAFKRALTALPVVMPSEETWQAIESWIEPASDAGHRFAVTHLLIAGLAHDIDALVWSLDADFQRMESLGLVRLYAGPASWPSPVPVEGRDAGGAHEMRIEVEGAAGQ